jgi:RNA polymerase sigma-32 factor
MADTPPRQRRKAVAATPDKAASPKVLPASRKPAPAKRATSKPGAGQQAGDAAEPQRETEEAGDEVEVEPDASLDDTAEADWVASDDAPDAVADRAGDAPKALAPLRETSLAQADLLQRYMAEVSRYPLIPREEETRIAREYIRTQDPKVAYRLVTANLRLVVKIAWEYRRAAFNLLDLIQEGNVGLMQGVKKYDPERGVKLSTYAAWWIRAYIIRYLMDNWRLVKLGTTQAQRKIFFNLRKEKEKLAREGFEPETRLLAERMNVSEQDVIDMDRRLGSDEFSLDAPVSDDSSLSYSDRLAEGGQAVDDRLAEEEVGQAFRTKLTEFASTLVPGSKEQYIFEKRLTSDEPLTLQEVGDHFHVSRERARQIEARMIQRLKEYMREHLPDFDQLSLTPPEE